MQDYLNHSLAFVYIELPLLDTQEHGRVWRSCPVLSTLVEGDGCDRWLIYPLYKEYITVWSTVKGVQHCMVHCRRGTKCIVHFTKGKILLSHSSGWWGPGQAGTRGEWASREGKVRTDNFKNYPFSHTHTNNEEKKYTTLLESLGLLGTKILVRLFVWRANSSFSRWRKSRWQLTVIFKHPVPA